MNLDAFRAELWAEMQETFYVENTALLLADRSGEAILGNKGSKIHKPIISKAKRVAYVPYADVTLVQRNSSKETLEITSSDWEHTNTVLDDTDKAQMAQFMLPGFIGRDLGKVLNDGVEKHFFGQIANAGHVLDGATFGGAAGSFVDFSGATVYDVFSRASRQLGIGDVPTEDLFAVMGPSDIEQIKKLVAQRETNFGDGVLANGLVQRWNRWTLVQNNNLPWTAKLKIATMPTDGDTVTLAGVKFTFKTALGSTAGNVLIGADAAAARTNLKKAILDEGTAGVHYVQLSDADDFTLRTKRNISCTSAEDMVFTGNGDIDVSETLTSATDVWSAKRRDAAFMRRGAIDLIVQVDPSSIEHTRKEKGHADIYKALVGRKAKLFSDGKESLVLVKTSADW